jgi:hypothetical protein
VRLVHWNAAEAKERAGFLENLGFQVDAEVPKGGAFFKELAETPPACLIIDLSRIPSQGRDLAVGVRQQKGTRWIPLVFLGGDPSKVETIRCLLPDALYADWDGIREVIARALAAPPADPVVPASRMAAYEGVPLAKRLGIKPRSTVALVAPPENLREILAELPEGVTLRSGLRPPGPVTLWFVRSLKELEKGLPGVQRRMGAALWVCWPKKASGVPSDLTQQAVREAGLASGLVDYKICSLDATWSGLCFARRRPPRPKSPASQDLAPRRPGI